MAYSNSPLVEYTIISPNRTSPRNNKIDRISIHCVVGQLTIETICNIFKPSSQKASCNYCVGKDGRVGMCVEEKDRSWCTSSGANDHRAITIETASDMEHPYAVTDAAYNGLLDLCEDICRRNGKKKLLWFGDKDRTLSYTPASDEMVMTVHRWFANKACPGDYLYNLHDEIAAEVTRRLGGSSGGEGGGEDTPTVPTLPKNAYAEYIWNFFMSKIGNEYGVAGLMGNLFAESMLYPNIVQGDVPISSVSVEYTAKVDSGEISKNDFVHNGPGGGGYGLAQWTFYTRKEALYDFYKNGGYSSIGSIELACDFLWHELQNDFPGVLSVLQNATSIREASNKVLHDFEAPADQSATVEEKRASNGQYYYNLFSGSAGGDDPSTGGNASVNTSKLAKLLLYAIATDQY